MVGHPESMFFWLHGDGRKQRLAARLVDAAGWHYLVSLTVKPQDALTRRLQLPIKGLGAYRAVAPLVPGCDRR
jgi:hypothetical protein